MSTNEEINEPGTPQHKTSQRVSSIFGMNFDNEPLPVMNVIQSAADRPRIQYQFIKNMFHVVGNFGFPKQDGNIRTFPCSFSWSKDGSVTDDIFLWYVEKVLFPLYPFAKDVEGKRVVIKADSGPGRLNERFLQSARDRGFYFFPGLPNGTELGQEMDQLFAYLKSIIEENRRQLYKRLFRQAEGRVPDDDDEEDFVIILNNDDDEDTEIIDADDMASFIALLNSKNEE